MPASILMLLVLASPQQEAPPVDVVDRGDVGQVTFSDETVVTATRSEVAIDRLPVGVSVLTSEQIEASPAHTVDGLLRRIPSFQLLRDQSSEVATTPSQSVSFRGLTGTSASRALVLVDGIPINDPMQGYVRWNQVPLDDVRRVEVVRWGSVVWGSLGIGGTINLVTETDRAPRIRAAAEVGERSRFGGTLAVGQSFGENRFTLRGSYREGDGYYRLVPRAPVDDRNASETKTAGATLDLSPSASTSLRVSGSWFGDLRGSTLIGDHERAEGLTVSLGGDHVADNGAWSYHLFGTRLDAASSTGRANRSLTAVTPNRDQYDIPAVGIGADVQWARTVGDHEVSLGADGRWSDGEIDERSGWDGNRFTAATDSGGTQVIDGVYVQDLIRLGGRWTLYGALRWDRWESKDGFRREFDLVRNEQTENTRFGSRSGSVISPSVGATVRVGNRSVGRIAAYGGFRAPTLSELYKPISGPPGKIESNPAAEPERLEGAEVGWLLQPNPRSRIEIAAYRGEVDGLIQNVTIGRAGDVAEIIEPCGLIPAGLSCRQRQNVGTIRSQGLELSAAWRSKRGVRLFADGVAQEVEVVSAPSQPQLVGKRVEQAPSWVVTTGVEGVLAADRLRYHLSHRWVSDRYSDDLETDYVGEVRALDLSLGWRVRTGFELALAVTNALDRENPAAINASRLEIGAPRQLSISLRWAGPP